MAVTVACRTVTSILPWLVVASASTRGSSPRSRMSRPALGPRMLDRDSHERLDQPGENDLARERLRGLDDGLDVQLFDRRADRGASDEAAPVPRCRCG